MRVSSKGWVVEVVGRDQLKVLYSYRDRLTDNPNILKARFLSWS